MEREEKGNLFLDFIALAILMRVDMNVIIITRLLSNFILVVFCLNEHPIAMLGGVKKHGKEKH